jgi:uncharacterized membrane protein
MTRDAKNIAIGVFLALVAFRLFEMLLHEIQGAVGLPVLLLILVLIVVAVFATTKKGLKLRR